MSFRKTLLLAALTLLAALGARPAQAKQCAEELFEDAGYVVCTIDPAASDLRLFWRNAQGQPYRTFSKVAKTVSNQGHNLVFAINAGMPTIQGVEQPLYLIPVPDIAALEFRQGHVSIVDMIENSGYRHPHGPEPCKAPATQGFGGLVAL